MTIPNEMMTLENFKRMERGVPPLPKPKIVRVEPEEPKIDNRIHFKDLPLDKVLRIQAFRKRRVQNAEGVRFIFYDAVIELKDSKPLIGTFLEGDFEKLKKLPVIRENSDARVLSAY